MAAIGRLTAGISHEIFNPLSSIIGPLEYLEEQFEAWGDAPDHETIRTAFGHINNSVTRIENIIKSLKTLYYRSPMEKDRIELCSLVASILLLHQGKDQGDITLTNLVDNNRYIIGNQEALTRILVNLISNATDAIRESGRRGEIIVSSDSGENESVIRVRDNGIGIPPDRVESIFDLFYTTKDPGKGTGLGLHLVRELCLRMGWSIAVESEPGAWTDFRISVPDQE